MALEESVVADLTIYQAVCLEEGIGGAETQQSHLYSTEAPLSRPWLRQSFCALDELVRAESPTGPLGWHVISIAISTNPK